VDEGESPLVTDSSVCTVAQMQEKFPAADLGEIFLSSA
jgi:hypothetical protein